MATSTAQEKVAGQISNTESTRLAEVYRLMAEANVARLDFEDAGNEYARLACREMELEADRTGQKYDAIRRIMQVENALTQKPHSASSAEAQVELDHEYRSYLRLQSEVVQAKNESFTRRESARMRMEQALVAVRVLGRFS